MNPLRLTLLALTLVALTAAGRAHAQSQATLDKARSTLENGLTVAPEHRCAPYVRKEYKYSSRKLEDALIERRGGRIESRYTGETFDSHRETDLSPLIALSEAHDSGACAWDNDRKSDFASNIDNFELATPTMNRHQKSSKDWAEWQPPQGRCYFAAKIVILKSLYRLTVDRAEYDALAQTLAAC